MGKNLNTIRFKGGNAKLWVENGKVNMVTFSLKKPLKNADSLYFGRNVIDRVNKRIRIIEE